MYKGSVIRKMCCAIYVLYGVFLEKYGAILGSYSVHTKNKKTCMCACILGRFVLYLLLILFCKEMNVLKSKPAYRMFLFTNFRCRCFDINELQKMLC
jgi:hypothetical protein